MAIKNLLHSQKYEARYKKLKSQSFADVDVHELRSEIKVLISGNKKYNLHDLVPLYFQALTPTLSKIRAQQKNLFFCKSFLDYLLIKK